MAYSAAFTHDSVQVISDFRLPGCALEHRDVTTGSVTFSASLAKGQPYTVTSLGAHCYFTLNGNSPSTTAGTGSSNLGIPVPDGSSLTFIAWDGQSSFKAITASGTARVVLAYATSGSSI